MLSLSIRRVVWIASLATISAPLLNPEATCASPKPTPGPVTTADECIGPPRARLYASASGSRGFLITSAPDTPDRVKGRMFAFSQYSTKDRTVWEAPLITPPWRALVSDGDVVVTLDIWCRAGWEHSLVVYGSKGRRIADYTLEDLLTAQEIRDRVTSSISSRDWTAGAVFSFEMNAPLQVLKIRFPWGRLLAIDLESGRLRVEAVGVTSPGNQNIDVKHVLENIRADVADEMPAYAIVRSGESSGGFHLSWQDGNNQLHISCDRRKSPEEAIQNLRQLRMAISAGVPAPLPRVADEPYYLSTYGWNIYLARGQFVCQIGSRSEEPTRRATTILLKRLDEAVER